ncbi:MAG: SUMF1/EgtB/PvdO family nonheme iron enzyme [Planctomycetes bacterium]|nr:SUMF1/EgtB/PvdO family nonheme iron enzyme [Planctomycetota bacterium]
MGRGGGFIGPRRLLLLVAAAAFAAWTLLARPTPVPFVGTDLADMVEVPAGSFSAAGRVFEVEGYWIDRFEVSEADWARYVAETGAEPLPIPAGVASDPDYPARFVDAAAAEAYARHNLKRLPNNLEWERASQGPGGSALPWGEAYLPAANTQEVWAGRGFLGWGVTRVGTFERGRSAAGCYDMIGNVWEWTTSDWSEALRLRLAGDPIPEPSTARRGVALVPQDPLRLFPWLWQAEDWRNLLVMLRQLEEGDVGPGFGGRGARFRPESSYRGMRLVRGGSFKTSIRGASPELERLDAEQTLGWDLGFRCAISGREVELQARLREAFADLGWRDPLHYLFAVLPARRKILDLGPGVLPHLLRTRARCEDETVAARLDDLIEAIGSER